MAHLAALQKHFSWGRQNCEGRIEFDVDCATTSMKPCPRILLIDRDDYLLALHRWDLKQTAQYSDQLYKT